MAEDGLLARPRRPLRGSHPEVRQVAPCGGDRLRVVVHPQVDDAVGVLDVDRPDLCGLVGAEAAALDHRRAAHADAGVLGCDHHVTAAEQRGVTGKAVAGGDSDQRNQPAQPREQIEGAAVEARDVRPVDVTGPPSASFREQHHRQPAALGHLEKPVLLEVVAHPLGAG